MTQKEEIILALECDLIPCIDSDGDIEYLGNDKQRANLGKLINKELTK